MAAGNSYQGCLDTCPAVSQFANALCLPFASCVSANQDSPPLLRSCPLFPCIPSHAALHPHGHARMLPLTHLMRPVSAPLLALQLTTLSVSGVYIPNARNRIFIPT